MLAQRGHQIVPPLGGAAQTRAETLALGSGHCWPRNQMTPLCRAFRSGRSWDRTSDLPRVRRPVHNI